MATLVTRSMWYPSGRAAPAVAFHVVVHLLMSAVPRQVVNLDEELCSGIPMWGWMTSPVRERNAVLTNELWKAAATHRPFEAVRSRTSPAVARFHVLAGPRLATALLGRPLPHSGEATCCTVVMVKYPESMPCSISDSSSSVSRIVCGIDGGSGW